MNIFSDLTFVDQIVSQAREYFFDRVLSWAMVLQIVAVGCSILLARKATEGFRAWVTRQQEQCASSRSPAQVQLDRSIDQNHDTGCQLRQSLDVEHLGHVVEHHVQRFEVELHERAILHLPAQPAALRVPREAGEGARYRHAKRPRADATPTQEYRSGGIAHI